MKPKTELLIRVHPKASRNLVTLKNGCIDVYLTAPPVDGKANEECIKLLSKKLRVPKSGIAIIKGQKSKSKKLLIEGLPENKIMKILNDNEK